MNRKTKKSKVKPFDFLPLSEYEKTLPLSNGDNDLTAQVYAAIYPLETIAKHLGIKTIAVITTVGAFDYLLNADGNMMGKPTGFDDLFVLLSSKGLDGAIILCNHIQSSDPKKRLFYNAAIVDCANYKFTLFTPNSVTLDLLPLVLNAVFSTMESTERLYLDRAVSVMDDIIGKLESVASCRADLQWLTGQILADLYNTSSEIARDHSVTDKPAFYYLQ